MVQVMNVAEYIAEFFHQKKIEDVFLVTGGGAMFLNDALTKHPKLSSSCFHHEQACAMAAESYYRVLNKPAIVNVTTGPGATNAITGVYGAYVDSAAMIVISGQVKRPTMKRYFSQDLRQLGDQEVDIVSIVQPITKYAVVLDQPTEIEYELEKAYHLATEGRPGPVWIDVPVDVQSMPIPKQKKRFKIAKKDLELKTHQIKKIETFLTLSKRPVVIVGTGIHHSKTIDEFHRFIKRWNLPVVSSFCASDVLPTDHPNFIGRQGTIGDRAGNFAVQNADFVLILGARMNIRQLSYDWKKFAPRAKKVMVDIDQAELDKPTLDLDLKIRADLKDFFRSLEKLKKRRVDHNYLAWCQARKEKYPAHVTNHDSQKKLNPYQAIFELSQKIPAKSVIVTADGAAAIIPFQTFKIKNGQRLFSNSGSAPMGFDLPAVIGASIAVKRTRLHHPQTFCFAGDGSIMMNLQELQTIKTLNLNVVIFIINNGGYLSILQTQTNYFKNNIFGCVDSPELSFPNFKKLSKGFGIKYIGVDSLRGLKALSFDHQGPLIVELIVDPEQLFEPKLVSKRLSDGTFYTPELDEMFPFLSDSELTKNRIRINDEAK